MVVYRADGTSPAQDGAEEVDLQRTLMEMSRRADCALFVHTFPLVGGGERRRAGREGEEKTMSSVEAT